MCTYSSPFIASAPGTSQVAQENDVNSHRPSDVHQWNTVFCMLTDMGYVCQVISKWSGGSLKDNYSPHIMQVDNYFISMMFL